jgi:hypothetical protein
MTHRWCTIAALLLAIALDGEGYSIPRRLHDPTKGQKRATSIAARELVPNVGRYTCIGFSGQDRFRNKNGGGEQSVCRDTRVNCGAPRTGRSFSAALHLPGLIDGVWGSEVPRGGISHWPTTGNPAGQIRRTAVTRLIPTRGDVIVLLTLAEARRIAGEVIAKEHPGVELLGLTTAGGGSRYTEVILGIRGCHAEPCQVVVGVSRGTSEQAFRREVRERVQEHLRG